MKIVPDEARTLEQLEELAERLGLTIRYEALGREGDPAPVRGGLCRVNDRQIIFVDERLGVMERIVVLAEALGRFDLSEVFVSPAIRRLVTRSAEWG